MLFLRDLKEASETSHIVDALNEVSNTFAVDTNNLTEILKRASGTIAQTGTSYEELLGLSTAGFESLRNAEMVASGINMISQRLRGMKEDGESVEGLIPKIQADLDKYTQGAVSVIDKQNGGLHSTYEILSQLSKVYPTLTSEAKAFINESIAGNRQNKVLVAIMENWKNVEGAIESATNAAGSANRENEKYLSSLAGRVSLLTSQTEMLWKNTINSELIKFVIDVSTAIIKLVDQVGLLATALAGLWIYLSLTGKMTVLAPMITGWSMALGRFTMAATGFAAAAGALSTALATIAPLAIVAGIILLSKHLIDLAGNFDGLYDAMSNSQRKTQENVEKLSSLSDEYEVLSQKVDQTTEDKIRLLDIERILKLSLAKQHRR